MRKHMVVTITGGDRAGIVEYVTKLLLEYNCNVESSRMARLAGEFAMLMLVSVPEDGFDSLREKIRALRQEDFKVTTHPTARGYSSRYVGWIPYQVKVKGADHEGIIYEIAREIAARGINIETMDTGMVSAPMSGTPLFTMSAVVIAPPELSFLQWREQMRETGDALGVDVEIETYAG